VNSQGGTGEIDVKAPPGFAWSVLGLPSWIAITHGAAGTGDGRVEYRIPENTSNQVRLAAFSIGDTTFEISQKRSPVIDVPFVENFRLPPIDVWDIPPKDPGSGPIQWVLDSQKGEETTMEVKAEGPDGGPSLLLERPQPASEAWRSQIYIRHINLRPGNEYAATLWLKAQPPGLVWLWLGQDTAPYHPCGLSEHMQATTVWTLQTVRFRSDGKGCGAENNRFAIQAGAISGKLWISKFSLVR